MESPSRPPARKGLVISGGAALGGAWAVGALCALAEAEGFDPTTSDVVVGTSAGSILAALIGRGVPPDVMARRLSGGPGELEGTEPVNPISMRDDVYRAVEDIPPPLPLLGNLLLAARILGRPDRHTVLTAAAALAPQGRGDLAPVGVLAQR